MALHGLGVANPITAMDYADRGLVVRKLSVVVTFSCLLAILGAIHAGRQDAVAADLITKRCGQAATIVTRNLDFDEWDQAFATPKGTTAQTQAGI
jgi:hypothetical protein